MSQMENFKYIISEERRRAGLTQEALATRIGITPQAVSKWENGVGYPDVTLFPIIADVLGIPISRLFGEAEKSVAPAGVMPSLPEVYQGLPLVCTNGRYVCYSDKTLTSTREEGGIAVFSDGSEANLNLGVATNRGAGEVRVYECADIMPEAVWEDTANGETSLEREFPFHPALNLSVSRACDIHILAAESGKEGICRVCAIGDPSFISAITLTDEGERLSLEVKSRDRDGGSNGNHRITISVGADHANLLKCKLNAVGDVRVVPDFDRMEVLINGSADLTANGVGEASFKINGAGDINLREVAVSADMHINGSGDISVQHCASPKIHINGSGDVKCGDVHGTMSATINGSGDITCGGDVARLDLRINGSGDFHGKELSVTDAEIKVPQGSSAEITIGQIRGTSVEKLSRECTLRVGKRGV